MSKYPISLFGLAISLLSVVLFPSCDPSAKYATENVEVYMSIQNVSAGFVECNFSTNVEAYYLIACVEAEEGVNPQDHAKQFMTLALDSANVEYLAWRNSLLKKGEFNVAPFSSHSLQYGSIHHFFTGLMFETDYWVYAFAVDPVKMEPVSKLYIQKVTTLDESNVAVRFDYRIKGSWCYIYPIDSITGHINSNFPYVTSTFDSVDLAEIIQNPDFIAMCDSMDLQPIPQSFFAIWLATHFLIPDSVESLYGVYANNYDGSDTTQLELIEGTTYYTFIAGYDFCNDQAALYKYRWTTDYEHYFSEPENIMWDTIPDNTGLSIIQRKCVLR